MTVIDTDLFTLVYYNRPALSRRVIAARDAGDLAVPSIVRGQILIGRIDALLKAGTAADVLRMQDRLAHAEARLREYPILPFDAAAGEHFDRLRPNKKLKKMGVVDLLIACIALAYNATLLTRNVKDFQPVPNLRIENWAE